LLSFDLPSENASNRITFSKAASDGYKFNTDFHTVNFSQNSQLRIDNLTFLLSSGYNEKHFGANNFYIPIFPNPNQYEETKLAYAQSGLIYQREQFSFRQQVYLRKHNDEYFWNKFESEPNIHESVTMGTELSAQLNHVYGITSAGFEYISESLESNSLGIEEKRNRYGLFTHERHTSGLFLQHQLAWNKLLLNVGGSLYHYTDEGWHGWPGIDLAYKWSAHSKMYASYSEGFRVPTYTNLYLNFPASALPFVRAFGNETLKNEQSQNYEAGYKYSGESIILEAALFQRNDKNIVDYVYNTADTLYRAENILKLATIGFEGGLKFRNPIKGVQSLYTQYSYLDPDTDLSGKITIYALSHFKHQLLAGIDLYLPGFPNLSSNWKVRYEERIISNAHTLIDTRLSWKNDFLRLYLDITNLLDVEYEDIPGVRMPGRWAKLGFEYNLLSQ
jgi:iron complex outermembrane receptor protein